VIYSLLVSEVVFREIRIGVGGGFCWQTSRQSETDCSRFSLGFGLRLFVRDVDVMCVLCSFWEWCDVKVICAIPSTDRFTCALVREICCCGFIK